MATEPLQDIAAAMGAFYVDRLFPLEENGQYIAMSVRRESTAPTPSVKFIFTPYVQGGHVQQYPLCQFLEVADDGKRLEARCYRDVGSSIFEGKVNTLLRQFLEEIGFEEPTTDTKLSTGWPSVATYARQHQGGV